jgi:hypothetical protein
MEKKDIISKRIFKHLVRDFARYLFDLPVIDVQLLETSQERVEDRHADLVARVGTSSGETFILHIEIQNDNRPNMPVRMLRYLSDILLAHPKHTVRQYLVYIGKKPLRMADGLKLPHLSYHYEVIDMHQVDCHGLLQQDSPDAWILAVLCDFKGCESREIVHTILSKLMASLSEQPPQLREYVSMLEILASNRDLDLNISEEFEMLSIDFEKLPTYRMGMEKGMEKGAYEQAIIIAKNLLNQHMDIAYVASATGLSLAIVEQLQAKISN